MKKISKEIQSKLVLAIPVFSLGLAIGLFVLNPKIFIEKSVPSLTALIATFAGAWFAFKLQSNKENIKTQKAIKLSANKALHELLFAFEQLTLLKNTWIEPAVERSNNPDLYWLSLTPAVKEQFKNIKLSFNELIFITETSRPEFYYKLQSAEEGHNNLVNFFNMFSHNKITYVMPAINELGVTGGDTLDEDKVTQIQAKIGEVMFMEQQSMARAVVQNVQKCMDEIKNIGVEFNNFVGREYGHKYLVRVEF